MPKVVPVDAMALGADAPRELATGDELLLTVRENPSTGYIWDVAVEGGLELARTSFSLDASEAIGAGGTREFWVRATRPGDAVVRCRQSRPWEDGVPALRDVRIPVRVTAR